MNHLAKILAFTSAAAMAGLCLTACGNTDSAAAPTSAETIATETTEQVDDTIVIGCSGPMSGEAVQYGMSVRDAIVLAVDEINESKTLGNIKLKAVFEDDKGSSGEEAIEAYHKLKENGMDIMIGAVTSGSSIAIADLTKNDNIFQLTPSASSPEVIKNDNCFQVCFSDPNQGKASADYIVDNNMAVNVAIIYDSDDTYSKGIYETFKDEANIKGLNIVAETSFDNNHKDDMTAQVAAAKNADADMIFMPVYYQEAANIIKAAGSTDYKPLFFGCDGIDGILGTENFNIIQANDTYFLSPFLADADDEITKSFVKNYGLNYGFSDVPSQFAADAYDCVMIIADLIQKEHITPDMTASEMCDKLKTAITNDYSYSGLTGANMVWSADGSVTKEPKAIVITDGEYRTPDFKTTSKTTDTKEPDPNEGSTTPQAPTYNNESSASDGAEN